LVLDREDFTRGTRGCPCRRTGAHLHLPKMCTAAAAWTRVGVTRGDN